MNISHILEAFYAIADKEGWHGHHTPKNLAAAISVESAELLEQFMWLEDGNELTETQKQAVGQEIADVAMYLVVLCDKLGLSIDEVIANKLALNAQRHTKTTK
ncbi:nucleotide pyrophosphohydrolase [Saccharophagus degradans]|uniref:MazG nucleotide pyrophosphohydrolase n=1 Tax=Saccharophagus degradans (strain 2-40 / ATCC 43961 / DSM 17024) TaxID=203122 RepID=Q21JL1_SACD2|nr:nucleotide pyrophosphohydrolase [Saccharophagus degradans]ABD81118.1 conserved hypothetical protein [Saccharophagus degradans 2-40]